MPRTTWGHGDCFEETGRCAQGARSSCSNNEGGCRLCSSMPEHGACQPAHPNHHSHTITYTRHSTTKRVRNPADQEADKAYEHTEWHHARTARHDKAKAYNKSRDSPHKAKAYNKSRDSPQ
ncbi:hypothetical protein TorRG33x02_173720 [Trema orientale]|uniref:Uncharacterized protein n=1 Tax=Trema orientale TaxID=63057 RepID=A0A2P5EMT9_TREOI|nr:hypothetical protein TorRG33x02_173720 [Trema orientale]